MNGRFFIIFSMISLAVLCGCQAQGVTPAVEPAAALAPAEPAQTPAPAVQAAALVPAPAATPTPEPTPEPAPEDTYAGPELAEGEPVDDSFFADAAFLGNSLVDGLRYFGGLGQGSFFAATSASVVNVDTTLCASLESGEEATLIGALAERRYGKIYVLLGINEIGFEPEYFAELYGAVLDRVRGSEPDADIYIMSLTPVTQERSGSSEFFNMERVELYNEALLELARDRRCYFMDLCQALAGEDGFLPEEDSTDGIHLVPEKYPQWAEYLRTHIKQ